MFSLDSIAHRVFQLRKNVPEGVRNAIPSPFFKESINFLSVSLL